MQGRRECHRNHPLLPRHLGLRTGLQRHSCLQLVHMVTAANIQFTSSPTNLRYENPGFFNCYLLTSCNNPLTDERAVSGKVSDCSIDTTPTKHPTWTPPQAGIRNYN